MKHFNTYKDNVDHVGVPRESTVLERGWGGCEKHTFCQKTTHTFLGCHLISWLHELHQCQPFFLSFLLCLQQATAGEIQFSLQISFSHPLLFHFCEIQISGYKICSIGTNQEYHLNIFWIQRLFWAFCLNSSHNCFLKVAYLRLKKESL